MLFSKKDISELTSPIQEDAVCGIYLKSDKGAFRPLRNEFNVAQTSMRKLSQNPSAEEREILQEQNHENWEQLSQSLLKQFQTVTRDIELVSWFMASQVVLDEQLDALSNTLVWLGDLVEQQWDALNPVLPESKLKSDGDAGRAAEQYEAKAKAFFQLLGDSEESSLLYAPMLFQPLVGDISFYDYQSAERKGELNQLKQQASAYVGHERAQINQKLNNLTQCLEQIGRLAGLTREKANSLGVASPNFNFVKGLMTKYSAALQQLTGVKVELKAVASAPETQDQALESSHVEQPESSGINQTVASSVEAAAPMTLGAGNLSQTAKTNSMNRDVAFHLLREISDYFRQSEPHSPVSFLLEKAIRWGYLPLPELLQDMMAEQEGGQINQIFNAAGLNHLDQVLLPDVEVATVDIRKESTPVVPVSISEPVSVEQQVSESSTADTPLKQQTEKPSSSGSTALRW